MTPPFRSNPMPPLARLAAKARRDYGDAPPSKNYVIPGRCYPSHAPLIRQQAPSFIE